MYNPKEAEEAFCGKWKATFTPISAAGSEGEIRRGYLSAYAHKKGDLYIKPDTKRISFTQGETVDFDAMRNGNNIDQQVDWSIGGPMRIDSQGVAEIATSDSDYAGNYTVTATLGGGGGGPPVSVTAAADGNGNGANQAGPNQDRTQATAEFIPTAVQSISAKGKTSTADDVKTIYTAVDSEILFEATAQPAGGFLPPLPTWSADAENGDCELQQAETLCYVKFKEPGTYTVKARCGDDDDWEKMEVKVCDVGLQPVTSRSPSLADKGRICLNAQDEYKKAKFEVTVKPEGTTAEVTQDDDASDADITLSKNTLQDGDTFLVEQNGETGTYVIELEHNDCSNCTDTYTETVFKFVPFLSYVSYEVPEDFVWIGDIDRTWGPPDYRKDVGLYIETNSSSPRVDYKCIGGGPEDKLTGTEYTIGIIGDATGMDAEFGIKTEPAGAYDAEVGAAVNGSFNGELAIDYGTASWQCLVKIDGATLWKVNKNINNYKETGAWTENKTGNVIFTVGELGGSVSCVSHTCTQKKAGTRTPQKGSVDATYGVTIRGFEIVTP